MSMSRSWCTPRGVHGRKPTTLSTLRLRRGRHFRFPSSARSGTWLYDESYECANSLVDEHLSEVFDTEGRHHRYEHVRVRRASLDGSRDGQGVRNCTVSDWTIGRFVGLTEENEHESEVNGPSQSSMDRGFVDAPVRA